MDPRMVKYPAGEGDPLRDSADPSETKSRSRLSKGESARKYLQQARDELDPWLRGTANALGLAMAKKARKAGTQDRPPAWGQLQLQLQQLDAKYDDPVPASLLNMLAAAESNDSNASEFRESDQNRPISSSVFGEGSLEDLAAGVRILGFLCRQRGSDPHPWPRPRRAFTFADWVDDVDGPYGLRVLDWWRLAKMEQTYKHAFAFSAGWVYEAVAFPTTLRQEAGTDVQPAHDNDLGRALGLQAGEKAQSVAVPHGSGAYHLMPTRWAGISLAGKLGIREVSDYEELQRQMRNLISPWVPRRVQGKITETLAQMDLRSPPAYAGVWSQFPREAKSGFVHAQLAVLLGLGKLDDASYSFLRNRDLLFFFYPEVKFTMWRGVQYVHDMRGRAHGIDNLREPPRDPTAQDIARLLREPREGALLPENPHGRGLDRAVPVAQATTAENPATTAENPATTAENPAPREQLRGAERPARATQTTVKLEEAEEESDEKRALKRKIEGWRSKMAKELDKTGEPDEEQINEEDDKATGAHVSAASGAGGGKEAKRRRVAEN